MFQTEVVDEIKTYFVSRTFFPPESHAVYEIVGKDMVPPHKPHVTIQCCVKKMRFACRITKRRAQAHTNNISCLLLHISLILPDSCQMFYGITFKK